MKVLQLTMLAAFFFVSVLKPAKADEPYTRSYVILINNETSGTETVTEEKDRSGAVISRSEHELLLDDGLTRNRLVFSTEMVLSKGGKDIRTYASQYKTGQMGALGDSYDVSIKNGEITRVLIRSGQYSAVTAPFTQNMVIVDFNVYHHYEYLLRRYDLRKKGTQVFANFIPLIGNDIPLKVTWLGDLIMRFDKKNIETRKFQVEFADIQATTLFVDKSNRLVVLENPAQGLKVIRKDLLP